MVGALVAMAWDCLLVVTGMVEGGGAAGSNESQQISLAEMLLGDQDQNMLAWKLLGAEFAQRKRVIFLRMGDPVNRQGWK